MTTSTSDQPAFDPDALRAKYRAERDKRLREEGNEQYIEVKDEFAHFLDDPYVEPGFTREPLHDEVEVLVIGGGFGGLLAGARLRQAGVEDIRMIDPAGDFGGTWYWNRYPGIACDVESYTYLPMLEEVGYLPKEKYAYGKEILEYSQMMARKFDLYRDVCFQTRVEDLTWDEESARWIVSTNRGDRIKAHYVCIASGPLNRPKLPGIPGIREFEGHSFHASRWDYEYTGGDSEGDLSKLAGKRVGIIGTGATAVQCVPHLGEAAEHLYVFQRTPSSIDVKNNPKTDAEWAESLEPGWHQHRMDNFNALVSGVPQEVDLVNDGWTDLVRNLLVAMREGRSKDFTREGLADAAEMADFEKMESIRERVDSIVQDPATAEALKPYYRQFCKRPCFHNEYLDTFNRDNVTLGRYAGPGCRTHHQEGRGRRRQGVRARLPDLRQRVRSRHRLLATSRLPAARQGRQDTLGLVVHRRALVPRHARQRVPELFPDERLSGRVHRQLPPHAERAGQAPRLHHPQGSRSGPASRGGDARGRAAVDRAVHREGAHGG